MAAGDLENIRPVDKSGNIANLTRNINYVDSNNVMHSVAEVYWSDAQGQTHLIWKRDHAPVGDDYTQLYTNNWIFAKYVPTINSINKIKIWCSGQPTVYDSNVFAVIIDSNFERVIFVDISNGGGGARAAGKDTINVDGQSKEVYTLEYTFSSPVSVSSGNTYYVMLANRYSYTYKPYFNKNTAGDFLVYTGYDWELGSLTDFSSRVTAYNTNLVKMEVNGEQV